MEALGAPGAGARSGPFERLGLGAGAESGVPEVGAGAESGGLKAGAVALV